MTDASPLRVGVVDDSAFNRLCLSEWVQDTSDMTLMGAWQNGEEALREWLQNPPDVAVVDLEMPKLDGLTLVRLLMAKRPFPVVVFSSYASSDNVVRALEAGALRFVAKPEALDVDATQLRTELLNAVREASRVSVDRLTRPRAALPSMAPAEHRERAPASKFVFFVAGTGGPQAMFELVVGLRDLPNAAWVVLTHMPVKYIHALVSRLSAKTSLDVRVLEPAGPLVEGTVYVASVDEPMVVSPGPDGLRVVASSALNTHPADALLASAARVCAEVSTGVLLTGGGDDGVQGLREMRDAGSRTYAQSPDEAVVPDLARMAIERQAAREACTLNELKTLLGDPRQRSFVRGACV